MAGGEKILISDENLGEKGERAGLWKYWGDSEASELCALVGWAEGVEGCHLSRGTDGLSSDDC